MAGEVSKPHDHLFHAVFGEDKEGRQEVRCARGPVDSLNSTQSAAG